MTVVDKITHGSETDLDTHKHDQMSPHDNKVAIEMTKSSKTMDEWRQHEPNDFEKLPHTELNGVHLEIHGDSEEEPHPGCCTRRIESVEENIRLFCKTHSHAIWMCVKLCLLVLYLAYYIHCMTHRFGDEGSVILTVITAIILLRIVHTYVRRTKAWNSIVLSFYRVVRSNKANIHKTRIRYVLYVVAVVGLAVYLSLDVFSQGASNLQAFAGIAVLIIACFLTSAKPSRVNWHPVFWGFIIQFIFATITLRTDPGYQIFKWIGDLVNEFVKLSEKGSNFVLGASFRATAPGFFFETAGVVVFFNSCIFVLDFIGVLELIILTVGKLLNYILQTGPIESVVAAANIFIGLSEAPLLVRPYLPVITKSELHSIMSCGFASISGAFMAMFIAAGAPPTHLLTACLISAPAALAISKLMYPETEVVDFDKQRDIRTRDDSSPQTYVQAISDGATFSIKIVATIMVNMMAFVSLLNLVDHLLIWIGRRAGKDDLTFNFISSYVFYPVSWLMGIPREDCLQAGYLLGLKLLATPFVAYKDLGLLIHNREDFEHYTQHLNGTWHTSGDDIILDATNTTLVGGIMQPRTEAIVTYAMCGLSAFPAIGFTMGTLIPMSPARKPDVVKLVVRAFIAGNLANLATGAVAGVMYNS